MKVGSLVECIDTDFSNADKYMMSLHPVLPIKSRVYTIREIRGGFYGAAILLEEIKSLNNIYWNVEQGFIPERFREIQPPIANIEEHINENTLELVS